MCITNRRRAFWSTPQRPLLLACACTFFGGLGIARAAPRSVNPPSLTGGHSPADYSQEVARAKRTAAGLRGRFSFVIEPPFVVAGDSGPRDVRYHAEGLIRWSVTELKRHYFAKDPARIITIWLFKDRTSYIVNSIRLTGEPPGTPFGFFSSKLRALLMNISTGGGTLVHEIVHPFMEANVPGCPPWLNEGMGSLYEGVGRRNGAIWGYLNWRLPGVQRAIRARRLPALSDLMAADESEFYLRDPGTNYGQARYLLYYLQDRGLLRTYFTRYLAQRTTDPTGAKTLKQVLEIEDLPAFQKRWEKYVLSLKLVNPPVK